jgi:hypothetical protein
LTSFEAQQSASTCFFGGLQLDSPSQHGFESQQPFSRALASFEAQQSVSTCFVGGLPQQPLVHDACAGCGSPFEALPFSPSPSRVEELYFLAGKRSIEFSVTISIAPTKQNVRPGSLD